MDLTRCGHCGANFEPKDLTQPACRYCSTVLPHRARAVEQAEIMTQLLADKNRDGIPDALEDVVAAHVSAAMKTTPPQTHTVAEPAVQAPMATARSTEAGLGTWGQVGCLLAFGMLALLPAVLFLVYVFWDAISGN